MITYQVINESYLESIKALYVEHGWSAYLKDDNRLAEAFKNSLYTLGAFDGDHLIGFVRCLGDGQHCVLVQDLIVAESYTRQGLGRALMEKVFDKYASVRWIQVNTDATDERAKAFYQALGMKRVEEGNVVSYYRSIT